MSNSCWICDKLFDVGDDKVRDHCHITGKHRDAAHWSRNINLKSTKKIPVIFHNLRTYDSNLMIKEISKFDVKVSVIPNGSEKYMAFTISTNLIFIYSMQFMNSGLDSLGKNLSDNDFKYLPEEFSGEFLELVKQKGVYSYEYMDSFKNFSENKLTDRCKFFSSLKDVCISEIFENFISTCLDYYELDPCNFFSSPGISWDAIIKIAKIKLDLISDIDMHLFIEEGRRGGVSYIAKRHNKANNK